MSAFDSTRIAGSKLYICATAQTTALNASAFAALTWVEITRIGKFPETGIETNVVTYDTVDTDVSVKGKGVSKSKDWTVEYARIATDAGQDLVRTACENRNNYAFKAALADGSTVYNIGIVTGPTRGGGGPDDPIIETVVIGTNMRDVVAEAS